MSNAEPRPLPARHSPQYRQWLRRERHGRLTVRLTQLALLLVVLVLWEVLPRAQIVNPLFTSYPSAILADLRRHAQDDAAAGEHPHPHLVDASLATVVGFTAAMIVGTIIAAALWWWDGLYKVLDPYLVVANAMPKTAFVPIFYIWLGAVAVDLRHVARDLAVRHRADDLQRLPGHRSEQDQAGADVRRQQGANPHQGGAAGKRADPHRGAEGQRRPVAGRRRRRRIPVGEFRSRLSDPVRQPDLQGEYRDDGVTILAIVSSLMYLAISWLEAAVMRRR